MSDANLVTLSSRPKLAGFARLQHDVTRDRWVLQGPERVLALDGSSKDILDLCTGQATVEAIIETLAAEYDAPRDVIEHDVLAVLEVLAEKMFLILQNEHGTD
jgi:pyrroloquinoline quinone biosynthesis protein D